MVLWRCCAATLLFTLAITINVGRKRMLDGWLRHMGCGWHSTNMHVITPALREVTTSARCYACCSLLDILYTPTPRCQIDKKYSDTVAWQTSARTHRCILVFPYLQSCIRHFSSILIRQTNQKNGRKIWETQLFENRSKVELGVTRGSSCSSSTARCRNTNRHQSPPAWRTWFSWLRLRT